MPWAFPERRKKSQQEHVSQVLGLKFTVQMIVRIPSEKLTRAMQATTVALAGSSIPLEFAEQLGGFLGFCAEVVQLVRVYIRYL